MPAPTALFNSFSHLLFFNLLVLAQNTTNSTNGTDTTQPPQFKSISLKGFAEALAIIVKTDNEPLFAEPDYRPATGPYFIPLWKLSSPYNYYAEVGLPSKDTVADELNGFVKKGQFVAVWKGETKQYEISQVSENFTTYELFHTMALELSKTALSFWITEEEKNPGEDWNATIRVIYNEVIRPRYYLKFYIDAYRYLSAAQEKQCKGKSEVKTHSCAAIFPKLKRTPYEYVLWLYTWGICNLIGSDPELDVDAICPLVCRPHSAKTLAARKAVVGPALLYRDEANEDMLDVCEQLQHAVPGTCTLSGVGAGVQMNQFRCRCASAAYEWAKTDKVRGCLVSQRILDSFKLLKRYDSGNSSNFQNETVTSVWRMHCTKDEENKFCVTTHTDQCYYRVQKLSDGKLNETSRVRQTMRPFCHCKNGFTGLSCNESFDPCSHPNRHAINRATNYLTRHISDPFFLPEDPSSASGNYLCGLLTGQGECKSTGKSDGDFTCNCAKGYGEDKDYSNYSNCAKELPPAADTCGGSHCLHDGKCVKKTVDGKVPDSSTPKHQIVEVCECKEGYVGPLCELPENTWSEWEAWGPCTPHCGSKRYRFRVRLCIGEIGCIGSALESARCEDKPCPLLSDLDKMVKSPDIQSLEGTYYRASRATMLTWMLALVLPVELVLVIVGLIILEKFILPRH